MIWRWNGSQQLHAFFWIQSLMVKINWNGGLLISLVGFYFFLFLIMWEIRPDFVHFHPTFRSDVWCLSVCCSFAFSLFVKTKNIYADLGSFRRHISGLNQCWRKEKCGITPDWLGKLTLISSRLSVCLRSELSEHVDNIDTSLDNLQTILNSQTFTFDTTPLMEVSMAVP